MTSRRDFLKTSALAGAALATSSFAAPKAEVAGAWVAAKAVNPSIDNLRVVSCKDPRMVTADPHEWNEEAQNGVIDASRVSNALDAMAMSLAQKKTPAEAWATIFQKPASKKWEEVRVAIKPNCFVKNHPRVAVLAKVCNELIALGVAAKNITIFDARADAGIYTRFVGNGLPKDIVISKHADALGGIGDTVTPSPCSKKVWTVVDLSKGSVDILINMAVNKGHDGSVGATTLTLKNHAGTFDPMPIHTGGGLDYVIAFNKSKEILGGDPVRQQLCIVDSLWAQEKGPWGVPTKRLSTLTMGTFSPAVDWLVARRIREPELGVKHPESLDRFLSDFDYKDFAKLDLVTVTPSA